MKYTLNQLQIFLKVVQTKSITKAAEELHLTQPAVSIQLRNFQDQFDIPLTEVVGRKIYITEFGKEIALAAKQILEKVYEINYKTQSYKGQLFGQLKISIVSTAKYVMPYFLSGFIKKNPTVELKMDVTNKAGVIKSMEQNEIDFALVSILPSHMNVEKIDLLPNKLFLIGQGTPSRSPEKISREHFSQLPLILREQGSGTRQTMERFIDRNKIQLHNKIELATNEAVKQAIIAGLGYSVMPLIGIKTELINQELCIIPMKGLPVKTTWSLIWLKGKKHSPVAQAYLNYLLAEKSEIAETYFSWYEKY